MFDIRQSEAWETYLRKTGWKTFRTNSGVLLQYRKILGFINYATSKLPTDIKEKDIEEMVRHSRDNNIDYVQIEPKELNNVQAFRDHDFFNVTPVVHSATIRMDLMKSLDDLWSPLSSSAKNSIHKAKRSGVQIEIVESLNDHTKDIWTELINKHKFMGYKRWYDVKTLLNCFADSAVSICAYDGDILLNAYLYFIAKRGSEQNAHYFIAYTNPNTNHKASGDYTFWESMRMLKDKGLTSIDFEGIYDSRYNRRHREWKGFTHFKRKFGGEEIYFPIPYAKLLSIKGLVLRLGR